MKREGTIRRLMYRLTKWRGVVEGSGEPVEPKEFWTPRSRHQGDALQTEVVEWLEPDAGRIFSRSLEQRLLLHSGKWVAVTGDEEFFVGDSPSDALALARRNGHEDVLLHRVPKPGE